MATIVMYDPIPPIDQNGQGEYRLTIDPDRPPPTGGLVQDNYGHSEPWRSDNGSSAYVTIFGTPPFVVTEN